MTKVAGSSAAFEADYRVRFDEAGPDGRLRTSGLLRYTQDLAAQHSAALGYDRAWYAARGLTWLVRAAELDILGPMPYGVEVRRDDPRHRVPTRVVAPRVDVPGWGPGGAVVRIDWVLLDERGAPTRIPSEFEVFVPGSKPTAGLQLGRVALDEPPTGALRHTIAVRPQELDPLDHVNNAVYADWLDEAVLAASENGTTIVRGLPRRVRLEYALAAEPGERLEIVTWQHRGRLVVPSGPSCRRSGPPPRAAGGGKVKTALGARRRRRRTFRGACRLRRYDPVDDARRRSPRPGHHPPLHRP